ncbi:MAG: hypothetical protein ABR548_06615 [Actinomycetota bacterium]|nr:hypothetical protein [Actinomycetota bacterium]
MGKYVRLGSDPNAERWTLAEDTDVATAQKQLEEAMRDQTTTRLSVLVGEDRLIDLIVNGRVLEAAMVWEVGTQQPTFSIID